MPIQIGLLDFEDSDIWAFIERMKHEIVTSLDVMISSVRRTKPGKLQWVNRIVSTLLSHVMINQLHVEP